jgi:hypothetical protein
MTNKDRLYLFYESQFVAENFSTNYDDTTEVLTVSDSVDSLQFCIKNNLVYNITDHKYEQEIA